MTTTQPSRAQRALRRHNQLPGPSSSKPEAAKDKLEASTSHAESRRLPPLEGEKLRGWSMRLSHRPRSPASRNSTTESGDLATPRRDDGLRREDSNLANTLRQSGPKKKSNYEKAGERYLQQRAKCNGLQRQFESSFCALQTSVEDGCESLQNCYRATLGSWESSKPDFQAMEASRKATFLAAEKVICLVTAMMQTQVLDNDIAECDNLNVDTSALTLPPFRQAPRLPGCDYSSVSRRPATKTLSIGTTPLSRNGMEKPCGHLHSLRKRQVLHRALIGRISSASHDSL